MKKAFLFFLLVYMACVCDCLAQNDVVPGDTIAPTQERELGYFDKVRENVLHLADELMPYYDTILVETSDNVIFFVVTNQAIYDDGDFDGFELLMAKKAKKSFFIKEIDDRKYGVNFSRDIFHLSEEESKTKTIDIMTVRLPYMAIVAKGKIIFEHYLPRCSFLSDDKINIIHNSLAMMKILETIQEKGIWKSE